MELGRGSWGPFPGQPCPASAARALQEGAIVDQALFSLSFQVKAFLLIIESFPYILSYGNCGGRACVWGHLRPPVPTVETSLGGMIYLVLQRPFPP